MHQLSCPGAHAQNGVAERKHRHILETTRALLLGAFVPPHFWAEAVSTVVSLINLLPSPLLHDRSPGECLHGTPPRYDHLRVFGCRCYVLLPTRSERSSLPSLLLVCFLATALNTKDTVATTLLSVVFATLVMSLLTSLPPFMLLPHLLSHLYHLSHCPSCSPPL